MTADRQPRDGNSTLDFYARHAEAYFERTKAIDVARVDRSFELCLKTPSRILDLGCGSGRDARHFSSAGHSVVAMDPCPRLLGLARRNTARRLGDRIHFVIGRAPRLALAGGRLDAVWACASLLHLRRPEMHPALRECHRVLAPGGTLALAVKEGQGEGTARDGRFFTFWTLDDLIRVVCAADFDIVSANRQPSLDDRSEVTWLNVLATA